MTKKITVSTMITKKDTYTCTDVTSRVSREQGEDVVNLNFIEGHDKYGPVDWVTYTPTLRIQCRPAPDIKQPAEVSE